MWEWAVEEDEVRSARQSNCLARLSFRYIYKRSKTTRRVVSVRQFKIVLPRPSIADKRLCQ